MGEVYRATDTVLGRTVAVKLLSYRHAAEPEAHARFRREALAAARVSASKHVVTLYDVGEHEGRPLIVMEYVEGGSVHERLRAGTVTRELALRWLEQAGQALDRAHAEGVVHRDVKPANLLLDRDENVHVSDFGIASTTGFDTLTLPGTILGTVGYLSPEQARGEPATPASDRYGLAVVAFELLTGRRPFASDTATSEVLAHATAPVPSARSLAPTLPEPVDAVFERALAKDPAARPPTCAELVADLRSALGEDDARAVAPTVALAPEPATRRLVRARPVRRGSRRWGVVLAAALVAATIGVAALLLTGGGGESSASGEPPRTTSARVPRPNGAALNRAGFVRLQAGDYEAALPLLRRAVLALHGSGSLTEAYAEYNLAYSRFQVGGCEGILGLLAVSEGIQGYRSEIAALRARWQERCSPPPSPSSDEQGNGKGRGKGKKKD